MSRTKAPRFCRSIFCSAMIMLLIVYTGVSSSAGRIACGIETSAGNALQVDEPIRFDGLRWGSPSSSVQSILADRGFTFVYRYEDMTLVYSGLVDGVETMVYAYFSSGDELNRVNLLLDENSEHVNVQRFLEVRAQYSRRYSLHKRMTSPVELESPDIEAMETSRLIDLAREDQDRVWSGWFHVDSEGDTTMVKLHLRRLSEVDPWPGRLVTRIWFYSPQWFRQGIKDGVLTRACSWQQRGTVSSLLLDNLPLQLTRKPLCTRSRALSEY